MYVCRRYGCGFVFPRVIVNFNNWFDAVLPGGFGKIVLMELGL